MVSELQSADVYTDFSGLASLKRLARDNKDAAIGKVAKQFEAMFLQMMLKSMRQASFGDPLFDSQQSKFYQDMYDQQLALSLSEGPGIGLADTLARQLGGHPTTKKVTGLSLTSATGSSAAPQAVSAPALSATPAVSVPKTASTTRPLSSPEDFVHTLWPLAQRAASELGTQPEVLLAQAALETGWGKSVQRQANGESSYNLFNIKADENWPGKRMVVNTVEFEHGVAVQRRAAFRAYGSYEESFKDYVDFLRANPRYSDALRSSGDPQAFVAELHRAGYATDPNYANKVSRVMRSDVLSAAVDTLKNQPAGTLS